MHKMDLVPADVRANVFAKQVGGGKGKGGSVSERESGLCVCVLIHF